jgi:putative transposase
MAVCRSTIRYESKRSDGMKVRDQVKQIASERRRLGCWRIHFLLGREGIKVHL